MLYIGIDLGTSSVKILLMEGDGTVKKIVSREYPLSFPKPGWSEQNPSDWYTQTMDGLKELLQEADKSQVAGISFGGQMHGLAAKGLSGIQADRSSCYRCIRRIRYAAFRCEKQEMVTGNVRYLPYFDRTAAGTF